MDDRMDDGEDGLLTLKVQTQQESLPEATPSYKLSRSVSPQIPTLRARLLWAAHSYLPNHTIYPCHGGKAWLLDYGTRVPYYDGCAHGIFSICQSGALTLPLGPSLSPLTCFWEDLPAGGHYYRTSCCNLSPLSTLIRAFGGARCHWPVM